MDYEEILAKCGDKHRYQYLLMGLYGFVLFVTSMHFFSQDFISFVPDHWCYHEQLENRSFAEIEAIYRQFGRPACTRLDAIDGNNVTVSSKSCERWIYKYDFGFHSMNTELNWVCDSAYKARVGQSLFFLGSMCGTIIFGLLGDRVGRIRAVILANWCGFLGDFSTIFTNSLTAFSISRFISGLATDANSFLMYILVLEYVSPSLRNGGLNVVMGITYCMGLMTGSGLAVLVGHWRKFLACTSLPLLLVTTFYFMVQESAQWLVSRNDIDGAIKRLKRVAKINRREVSEKDFDAFRSYCQANYEDYKSQEVMQKQAKLLDMLKTPHMRSTSLKLVVIFMIITLCYNIIARGVEGLGISPFIMFTLNSLTLPPSGILQGLLQQRIGRKATFVGSLLLNTFIVVGVGLIMTQSISPSTAVLVALTLGTRLGVSISYGATMLFSTELIPTSVRSRGLSAIHVAGGASSFLSPYIQHFRLYFRAAPSLILGLLFCCCTYVALLLPDTYNKRLPISLAEGEEFGKGERMFDFLKIFTKKKSSKADLNADVELTSKPSEEEDKLLKDISVKNNI